MAAGVIHGWDLATGEHLFERVMLAWQVLPGGRVTVSEHEGDWVFQSLMKPQELKKGQINLHGKDLDNEVGRITYEPGRRYPPRLMTITPDERLLIAVVGNDLRIWQIPKLKD